MTTRLVLRRSIHLKCSTRPYAAGSPLRELPTRTSRYFGGLPVEKWI